ncbi:MAG: adenylosuccinate synthetase [Roseibium sp.]|uniref:adenylosuccinate synthetase n=1 Tax=Roseibium sp. TaxID=1936156 RepID=UPI003297C5ED
MKTALAVIGANWGDEGKGLAVDAIAHGMAQNGDDPVRVVRTNGGAQAGHGVERPDGARHVFHHVGAGAFTGASTHLSQFFVAHPMVLAKELEDLSGLGVEPVITIDPRAPVTTPWDMAINQAVERARGGLRHGSTGLGFGETIERMENGPKLVAADLWGHPSDLRDILSEIRDVWSEKRLDGLGVEDMGGRELRQVFDPKTGILERFLVDVIHFKEQVSLMDDMEIKEGHQVLFEGAQGLRLDMDQGEMPWVTRSNTGLKNMLVVAEEAGIDTVSPFYMTRAYATRHGAGPLPHEPFDEEGLPVDIDWLNVVDKTNAPNPWQGHIRHAPLDLDVLKASIDYDLALAEDSPVAVFPRLGITCLDQIVDMGGLMRGGVILRSPPVNMTSYMGHHVGLEVGMTSWGPTREDVRWNWLEVEPFLGDRENSDPAP